MNKILLASILRAGLWSLCVFAPFYGSQIAWAQDDDGEFDEIDNGDTGNQDSEIPGGVNMGLPTTQGTGCASANSSAVLSPDSKLLSILFDGYRVAAGGSSGLPTDTRFCNLRIPFNVPQGYRVVVTRIDYRGFVQTQANGGRVTLKAQYNLSQPGSTASYTPTVKRQRIFTGRGAREFKLAARIRRLAQWSKCGEGFTMNINSQMLAQANMRQPQLEVSASLDSADISNRDRALKFYLKWQKCPARR